MRYKRTIAVFFILTLFFSFLLVRICLLMSGANSERLAFIASQQETKIKLYESRGQIYDVNLTSLTDRQNGIIAVIDPFLAKDEETIKRLLEPSQFESFATLYKANRPFSITVSKEITEMAGVTCFKIPQRFSPPFNASHILGYIDSKGLGANGIEKAYDSFLGEKKQTFAAVFSVDATRRALSGLGMKTEGELKQNKSGVVLTIDSTLQKIADDAADKFMTSGAIVILDIKTGEIRATASRPNFNPNDVQAAVLKDEGAFINRAFTPYNVGSVFKISVTAASLESGWTGDTFFCGGSIKVGQNEISCQKKDGHGKIDLTTAFAQSCNVYFIELAKKTGSNAVLGMAMNMGFGNELTLAPNFISKKGNLPTLKNLSATAALANFAIGQGEFLATPLQIAQMVSVVAGDGYERTPTLVKGLVDENLQYTEQTQNIAPRQIISKATADKIKGLMINTAVNGTGLKANPDRGGAGVKTATAETGIVKDGKLIIQGWIAGFFPANEPRYAVAVLAEDGISGGKSAGPIFKYIAENGFDYINNLDRK